MRFYRSLLRLLPREFLRRRGADLIAAADDQVAAAAEQGRLARARVALGLGTDVLSTAWDLRGRALLAGIGQDMRYALRNARRAPGFALVAVLTLAIGIAGPTTVFSLVNALYFKPMEFPDADRLVDVGETSVTQLCAGCGVGTSYPGFIDWRDRARSFEGLAAYREEPIVLSAPLDAQQIPGARVSAALFDVLGVAPVRGRTFTATDDVPGAAPVVLLSYGLWQRLFGSDPQVLGRVVRVNGAPAEIIGVMPPRMKFPEFAELWLPLRGAPPDPNRGERDYGVVARLRRDVSLPQAQAEMLSIAAGQLREHPETQAEWSADVVRLRDDRVGGELGGFVVMLAAVGLVLGIACANLAGLFLARASARHRELTMRAALGAGRARLVRQLLVESLALGAAGGALGLILARWGVNLAQAGFTLPMPYYVDFTPDWRVMAFCAVVTIVASVLVGLAPALTATRPNLVSGLKEGGATGLGSQPRQVRLRSLLVVGELALVLVLLAGAALTAKSFLRFLERPAGYDLRGLTLAQVPFAGRPSQDPRALAVALGDLHERLAAIANAHVALSHTEFVAGFGVEDRRIRVEGQEPVPAGASPRFAFAVSPGFAGAQGLRLVRGREFSSADRAGSPYVAVVNQQLADLIWQQRTPLGARLQLQPGVPGAPWWTVVGVVSNMEGDAAPGRRVRPYVYVPLSQSPGRPVDVLIRTAVPMNAAVASVRAALAQFDPDEPLHNVRSAEEDHFRGTWTARYFASFYGAFAAFALLLAVIGVYGIVSQTVTDRMREFGIRVALGADRRRLYHLVLGRSARLAAMGVVIGLGGAALTTRFLGFLLYGANPNDPAVLAIVALTLATTTMAASYLPARRAARVDPVIALRNE